MEHNSQGHRTGKLMRLHGLSVLRNPDNKVVWATLSVGFRDHDQHIRRKRVIFLLQIRLTM